MTPMGAGSLIYERLALIVADLKAVEKDATNQSQGWSYQSVDAIVAALHPLLGIHQVVIVPVTLERSYETTAKGWVAQVLVEYRCVATDGSAVSAVVPGVGHDPGDKAMTKAMTYAYKTFLRQLFVIADEDPDAQTVTDSGRIGSRSGGEPQGVASRGSAPKDSVPRAGKSKVTQMPRPSDEDVARHPAADGPLLRQDQAIAARAKMLKLDEQTRVDVIRAVAGPQVMSGKELDANQVAQVMKQLRWLADGFIELKYDEDGIPSLVDSRPPNPGPPS